jgi:hypothetical protein
MSTTAERLATLNALRATHGKAPIKAWKESRAKLEAAIEALSPPVRKEPARKVSTGQTLADWCKENDFDPKVARAKLRRAGIGKDKDGHYTMTAEIEKFLNQ